jgi:two-component system cell cycle response regulator DivK
MSSNQDFLNIHEHGDGQPSPLQTSTGKSLVLIVEDDEDTRFMLRMMLEMRGFEVIEALDGLEAIETAERERPQLILMDGTLPFLDGLAATRRIREYALLRDVPIIALSGHTTQAFQAAAFAAGCNAYLIKPFAFEQLDRLLNQFLQVQPKAS